MTSAAESNALPAGEDLATKANAFQVFRNTATFGALNGVRALCCVGVLKGHTGWVFGSPRCLDYDYLGVDLFFIISGFLIVTLLIREQERKETISLSKFYARRTLRIFPIYYLLILLVLVPYLAISPWKPAGWEYYKWTFVGLLTYTQNIFILKLGIFFHTWSLAMEEQFYLAWPAVQKYLSRAGCWAVLALVVGVSQIINFGLADKLITQIYGTELGVDMPMYHITFTPIALGVALAYLLSKPKTFSGLYALLGRRWTFVVPLLAVLAILELSPKDLAGVPRLSVQLLLTSMLGAMVIREDHAAMPFLKFKPLAAMGAMTYGIYLYHVVLMDLMSHVPALSELTALPAIRFFVVSTMAIGVAWVSFTYFEGPLLRMRHRFQN
jgi:peptidoglycan/LPS O-acetylase OafA/YrhL